MPKAPVLIDQYGNPVQRSILKEEVAGPTLSGVRSPIAGYPGDGLNPSRLAAILREADQGEPLRYFELAETIEERDLHYAGVLGTRKRSVAQIDVSVDAAGDDAVSVRHADLVREWLDRDELQDELFDILDAIGKGVSLTEIVWEVSEGQWRPGRLEWRDPRWFRFAREDGRAPLLRTDEGDRPLDPFKFINLTVRAKSGLPVRSGIARIACWAWMFKAYTQRDWAIFTQTYGQPIRVGKYNAGATEEQKDTLFNAVANIAADCAAIIPDGMVIEFIQAEGTGTTSDLYLKRSDWLDQQVSKAVLGQTATTDAIAGGHAVGREHRQVQEDIETADAKAVSAVLNRDLIRPWIDLEFGPQKAYPRLRIARPDEEDLDLMSRSLERLVPLGLRVEASQVLDKLGFTEPADGAEILTPPSQPPLVPADSPDQVRGGTQSGSPPARGRAGEEEARTAKGRTGKEEEARQAQQQEARSAERATGKQRDQIDDLADAAETMAAAAGDSLVDAIRELVTRADSLEEVRDGLAALKPDMPADAFARAMQAALAYAELTGRAEIAEAAT